MAMWDPGRAAISAARSTAWTGRRARRAVSNVCGDGHVGPGEACDTAGNSATCDADCTEPVCGDEILNAAAGEACDSGPGGNNDAWYCTADCSLNTCGDGKVFVGVEACDDGAATGDGTVSDCTPTCEITVCGDGYDGVSEPCDDGNLLNDDGCLLDAVTSECVVATCGDGVQYVGVEACDDGANTGVEGSSDCLPGCGATNVCGDSHTGTTEDCDDAGESASCDANCTLATCGDTTVNGTAGEECDDGTATAVCTDQCTNSSCGDGIVNAAAGEVCDVAVPDAGVKQ